MYPTAKALTLISVVTLLAGCSRTKPVPQPTTDIASEIKALIEKLAISNEPAADAPVYTPSIDTPKSDPKAAAYAAAERIRTYGKDAFPYLLKHLDDQRQSVAFRRVLPSTVGDACFCIIRDQVFNLPKDY